jgi:hypothetical protein
MKQLKSGEKGLRQVASVCYLQSWPGKADLLILGPIFFLHSMITILLREWILPVKSGPHLSSHSPYNGDRVKQLSLGSLGIGFLELNGFWYMLQAFDLCWLESSLVTPNGYACDSRLWDLLESSQPGSHF